MRRLLPRLVTLAIIVLAVSLVCFAWLAATSGLSSGVDVLLVVICGAVAFLAVTATISPEDLRVAWRDAMSLAKGAGSEAHASPPPNPPQTGQSPASTVPLTATPEWRTLLLDADPGIRAMRTRLDYVPTDCDSHLELARRYISQGLYREGLSEYREVLSRRPEFHDVRMEFVDRLVDLKLWDEAETEAKYLTAIQRCAREAHERLDLIAKLRRLD